MFVQAEVEEKEAAARESRQLMEMYAGKLARVERQMKEEIDQEDDDHYIEITIPFSLM